ncbi:DUF6932 family protein [Nocardia sp. NPDC051570]|uniref:DUF6932 family protein n=1 Tax=Nocardia sp. NPDC051570 TaxID=3364324 RepID=UPI00379977AB
MDLPGWTDEGLLPPGCWPATIEQVHQRLVLEACDRETRQVVYHGLAAYAGQIREYLSAGRIRLHGRFVTRDGSPRSADGPPLILTVFPANRGELELLSAAEKLRVRALFTMTDLILVSDTRTQPRFKVVHPMGHHIAAHMVRDTDETAYDRGRFAADHTLAERGVVELSW